ncbi:histidinol-phosphate transaminase [Caulobacter sp. NIBR1757]|uniref:histidinol-phosphate transaminase n=1 Tax=Caulobacter sp. NIBR1757 TaxID=3016000 RepID=UPI0022F0DA52|nr:histidinol-phosphate transaminase [Caulobacter sp. NIBR1757]WGM38978.1 Histidinol-phosphate aminotransferase [Caulobacter sp. NIBR1757]
MTDRFAAPRPVPKPGILDIAPYKPGKAAAEGVASPIKLSANENILGCSDEARAAYAEAAGKLNLYPAGRADILRAAVAEKYNLEPERLLFGCGSDEIFQLLNQTFLEPGDNMIQGAHGFAAYAIGTHACGGVVKYVPEKNFTIDVDAMLEAVDERTRLIFLANPANPTGTWIDADEVRRLHEGLPPSVVLVLDGAYAEFNTDPRFEDGLGLARNAHNIVVTRTFSKIHGLAALRVGWGYMPAEMADAVDRIRLPFNVNIPAQLAAVAALKDEAFAARSVALVEQWRPWLTQQINGLGLDVVPSAANFVLVGFPEVSGKTAVEAEGFLATKGLLTRGVGNYGLVNHLRITIGLEEHNRAVVEGLAEFMGK